MRYRRAMRNLQIYDLVYIIKDMVMDLTYKGEHVFNYTGFKNYEKEQKEELARKAEERRRKEEEERLRNSPWHVKLKDLVVEHRKALSWVLGTILTLVVCISLI